MATHERQYKVATGFHFDYSKAAQAAACLLRREKSRRISISRMLTLLYIADRECFRESGRPILGGRYVASDRGPRHSAMHELVQGADIQSPNWSTMFRRDHYDIEMISDPGCGELSKHEIEILNRVAADYADDDDYELRKQALTFAEVVAQLAPNGSVKAIPFEEMLKAVGREGDIDAISRDAEEKAVFDRVFGE